MTKTSVFLAGFFVLAAYGGAQAQTINVSPNVSMKVGQSRILHGIRSGCSKTAPPWAFAKANLPNSDLGTFSDGGTATRHSTGCNGVVPVRAVRFTARTKGTERMTLFDDPIRITVE